jgi:hypothetical protein
MMTLDYQYVGDREAMVYAQLGQQPLVRTTATSLEPRRGTLSCLSARPPDLAFWTGTWRRLAFECGAIFSVLLYKGYTRHRVGVPLRHGPAKLYS